jgi:hypothetical protein
MNDVWLTVFAEKTIEKLFISNLVHFTIDHDDQRIVCKLEDFLRFFILGFSKILRFFQRFFFIFDEVYEDFQQKI